jgi:hypothetical protein
MGIVNFFGSSCGVWVGSNRMGIEISERIFSLRNRMDG